MDAKKAALIKTIAILLSITPETPLGQFLRLCLEAKVDRQIAGETPLALSAGSPAPYPQDRSRDGSRRD